MGSTRAVARVSVRTFAPVTTQTVLTTGANSGIGLATVIEAARRGFHSVGSVRSEEKAVIVQQAAADAGVEVDTVLLEVTDADQCREVVAGLDLYGLVNNAGYGLMGSIEDVGEDEVLSAFDTMVHAPMRLARLALPGMRSRGGGRIVNVSSIFGRSALPLSGWYAATKHALEAATDALRVEVASSGIKVVLVEPGQVHSTALWDDFDRDATKRAGSSYSTAYRRSLRVTGAMTRIMTSPEKSARVIVDALTAKRPRARYLVGADAHMVRLLNAVTPTALTDAGLRRSLGL
jgi:short-subunit dehydrogenase